MILNVIEYWIFQIESKKTTLKNFFVNKYYLPVEFGVVWPDVFVLRVYNCNVQISKKAWVMFFVSYGNFPSYLYRALLVITWYYGARVYANQYMQISILNRTALFTA